MGVVRRASAAAPDVADYLDDEDEAPAARPAVPAQRTVKRASAAPTPEVEEEDENEQAVRSSAVQAGWGSAKKAIASSSGFTAEFKFTEEAQLVKFQGDAPIAVYKQHWLSEVKEGKRSYICLGEDENTGESLCPLCEILGHQPSTRIAFSVVNFSAEDPEVQMLVVGTRLAQTLQKYNDDAKVGPLDKHYWSLERTGKGTKTQYFSNVVKSRDIAEDWSLDPVATETAVATLKPLDASAVRLDKRSVMEQVARDLLNGND